MRANEARYGSRSFGEHVRLGWVGAALSGDLAGGSRGAAA